MARCEWQIVGCASRKFHNLAWSFDRERVQNWVILSYIHIESSYRSTSNRLRLSLISSLFLVSMVITSSNFNLALFIFIKFRNIN